MKHLILIIYLAAGIAGTAVNAQNPLSTLRELEGFRSRSGKYLMQIGEDDRIEGTPYLKDAFLPGSLLVNGRWYDSVNLRYNAFQKTFEVKINEGIFVIDTEKAVADTIMYNDETYVPKNIGKGRSIRLEYMGLIAEGEGFSLCKRYSVRMSNPVPADGYREAKPAEYKPNPPAYYLFKNGSAREIKGRKSIRELFGVTRRDLRRYLRKHDYSLRDEEDLQSVILHYTSQTH